MIIIYLTNEYQLIARSEQLSAAGGSYYGSFFTDTYARAVPNEMTGFYTVYVRLVLVCTITSEFYGYLTRFSGTINGQTAFSAEARQPDDAWEMRSYNGGYATVIAESGVQIDSSDGLEHVIPIATQWTFISSPADYTPAYGAMANASANVTLSAIPRASKISNLLSSNGCLDGEITYTLTPASKDLKNRQLVYYNGEKLFSSEVGSFSEYATIKIDLSDYLSLIYKTVIDTTKVKFSVTLETYNDLAVIGSEKDEVVLLIPTNDDTRPILDSAEIYPEYIQNVSFCGSYVKGKTSVGYKAEATAKYGASIADYQVKIDGTSQNVLSLAGDCEIEITAVDTRGISSLPAKFTITVYDYRVPIIVSHSGETAILCYRCDADGNQSDVGADCFLKFGKLFSEIPGNVCKVNYRLRGEGEPWGGYTSLSSAGTEYAGVLRGLFPNPSKAYHIQLQIIDGGNEYTTKAFPIAADWIDYQYNGELKSWSFGEACMPGRNKAFSLGLKTYFDKGVEPIAFVEDAEIYSATDEELLLSVSRLNDYVIFLVRLEGRDTDGVFLGIKWGDRIRLVGESSYIQLNETRLSIEGGAGMYITHIYGLI